MTRLDYVYEPPENVNPIGKYYTAPKGKFLMQTSVTYHGVPELGAANARSWGYTDYYWTYVNPDQKRPTKFRIGKHPDIGDNQTGQHILPRLLFSRPEDYARNLRVYVAAKQNDEKIATNEPRTYIIESTTATYALNQTADGGLFGSDGFLESNGPNTVFGQYLSRDDFSTGYVIDGLEGYNVAILTPSKKLDREEEEGDWDYKNTPKDFILYFLPYILDVGFTFNSFWLSAPRDSIKLWIEYDSYFSVYYKATADSSAESIELIEGNSFEDHFSPPIKEGYSFLGWSGTKEGKTISVDPSTLITTDYAGYTFTPIWKAKDYYIKFNINAPGHSIFKIDGSMPTQTFKYDEEQALAKNDYTRLGYYFDRWTSEADGGGVEFLDEADLFNAIEPDTTLTLYAQWKPVTTKINDKYYLAKINGKIYVPCIYNGSEWVPYGEKPT